MARKKEFNTKYSPEFKLSVILDRRTNSLSYHETVRKHNLGNDQIGGPRKMVQRWERIYLEEGAEGFMVERRGRKSTDRPRKKPLPLEKQQDLIDELQ